MGYYDGAIEVEPTYHDISLALKNKKCVGCPKSKWVWDDAAIMICKAKNDSCNFLNEEKLLEDIVKNRVFEQCPFFNGDLK